MAGIYIHIPFCLKKCGYCDFYSLSFDGALVKDYLAALQNQLRSFSGAANTVYFGGGTPSLLSPKAAGALLSSLKSSFSLAKDCEITLEANPATIGYDGLSALRELGFNRLSVGVQSFSDASLRAIGRQHGRKEALCTIADAKRAGFHNVSADLMLALPGEGEAEISSSVRGLAEAGVRHISAYLLKLMPGTPFYRFPPDGIPEDDRQADLYQYAVSLLAEQGYRQYEISNFAQPGYESRHNLIYWNCGDYFGFGAAAHSSLDGKRYSFPRDIRRFMAVYARTAAGNPLLSLQAEGAVDASDYLMMRLRLSEGLLLSEWKRRFGTEFSAGQLQKIRRFQSAGLLTFDGGVLALTVRGMLVSNSIIADLI